MQHAPVRRRWTLGGWRAGLIAAAAAVLVAAPALAAPPKETLRYGGDVNLAPFESLDAQGRPQGFQVELLAALGREIGAEIRIELRPWADTEAAFRAGELDLVAMPDTPGHRAWARLAHGHAAPALAVYLRRVDDEPQTLAALAGQQLAVLAAAAQQEVVHGVLAGLAARLQPHADASQALAALQRGDADLALLPRAHADPVLDQRLHPALRTGRLAVHPQPYALAVQPAQDLLLARVQRGLHALERSGELAVLRQRWFGSPQGPTPPMRALPAARAAASAAASMRGGPWAPAWAPAWAFGSAAAGALGLALWWRQRRARVADAARAAPPRQP